MEKGVIDITGGDDQSKMKTSDIGSGDRSPTTSWLPWQTKSGDWVSQVQLTAANIRATYFAYNKFVWLNRRVITIQETIEKIRLGIKQCVYQMVDYLLHQEWAGILSQQELSGIIQIMKFELIEMSLHEYRHQFVLRLLNHATESDAQLLIIEGLLPGVIKLMQSPRGVRIISECARIFPNEINQHLYCQIARHIGMIATNQVGYIQVNRLIENPRGRYIGCILTQISENALTLAEDQYGNFVVQKAIDLDSEDVTTCILTHLKGFYSHLSFSKYGSHVVEKCLDISDEEQVKEIVIEVLRSSDISTLLSDSFGNFVIQHMWDVSKDWKDIHEELALLIQHNASELRLSIHGRNVFEKLKECKRRRCLHKLMCI